MLHSSRPTPGRGMTTLLATPTAVAELLDRRVEDTRLAAMRFVAAEGSVALRILVEHLSTRPDADADETAIAMQVVSKALLDLFDEGTLTLDAERRVYPAAQ